MTDQHDHWLTSPFSHEDLSFEPPYIHETAFVDEPCEIGHGTQIMHFSHIMANSVIGFHCQIGHNVTIASGVMIGDNVRLLNNTSLSSGVIIEHDVYCGPCTVFTPLKYIRAEAGPVSRIQPTLVRKGASIGANTTVAAGFIIGHHSFVESGSVIDRHVPDYALMRGNPMTLIGWRCECGQILSFKHLDTECSECGTRYQQSSEYCVIKIPPPLPAA